MSVSGDESGNPDYQLPPELRKQARDAAELLRNKIEHIPQGSNILAWRELLIVRYVHDGWKHDITAADIVRFLEPLYRTRVLDSANPQLPPVKSHAAFGTRAGDVIIEFILRFFNQIRDALCKGPKGKLGSGTNITIYGLAAWLTSFLPQHSPLPPHEVTGLATAVLIALLLATKGAFCDMTEEAARAALRAHLSKSDRRK